LALEASSDGGVKFISEELGIEPTLIDPGSDADSMSMKRFLRGLTDQYDLISIDERGLPLTPNEMWRFLEGGKDRQPNGPPKDYGICNLAQNAVVIVNCAGGQNSLDLWYRLRNHHGPIFQGAFVGASCLKL
jgi:hypothetical protein